jgi:hypothetical protein
MLEIGSVNRKLVIGIELGFQAVGASPDITAGAFENEHAMIYSWTCKVAVHVLVGARRLVVFVPGAVHP